MRSKAIQICGTGSGVGKSVIVAGLCRVLLQDGYRVSPFKAQNMALNSFVTKEGGEIGRAQAFQAQACGIEPSVEMNPVLLKPTSDIGAQIIVRGKPVGNMKAMAYAKYKKKLRSIVRDSFDRLAAGYDLVVIEGAGSPAEINLKSHDIVNMKMAEYAKAPVILVGDIDKGGVFASLVGTLELLDKSERKRIEGFIINKFRGEKKLLKTGIDFLEKKTGKPVLGVLPYFKDIIIQEEDSVYLENNKGNDPADFSDRKAINIAVIKLPYISNFTDFEPLRNEPDVNFAYADAGYDLDNADIIIIPGTKNTIADLKWLKNTGVSKDIARVLNSRRKIPAVVGICGGYQMLGKAIYDADGIESGQKEIRGLGLLPIVTEFKKEKVLLQTEAIEIESGIKLKGYEIHHGQTKELKSCPPVFKIKKGDRSDGTQLDHGRVWGTYLHGIFDNGDFRRHFLNRARKNKGLDALSGTGDRFNLDHEFDKLAALLRENIDMKLFYNILNHEL